MLPLDLTATILSIPLHQTTIRAHPSTGYERHTIWNLFPEFLIKNGKGLMKERMQFFH